MKTFENQGAQGDCLLIKLEALPERLVKIDEEGSAHVLAHSETGHNHVIEKRSDITFYKSVDQFRGYLEVKNHPAILKHLRDYDTHEALKVSPGIYEIRRQREYSPEGVRRVVD